MLRRFRIYIRSWLFPSTFYRRRINNENEKGARLNFAEFLLSLAVSLIVFLTAIFVNIFRLFSEASTRIVFPSADDTHVIPVRISINFPSHKTFCLHADQTKHIKSNLCTYAHTHRQFNTITKKDLDQNSGQNLYTSKLLPSAYFPFYSIAEKAEKLHADKSRLAVIFFVGRRKLTFPSANFPDVNWIGAHAVLTRLVSRRLSKFVLYVLWLQIQWNLSGSTLIKIASSIIFRAQGNNCFIRELSPVADTCRNRCIYKYRKYIHERE